MRTNKDLQSIFRGLILLFLMYVGPVLADEEKFKEHPLDGVNMEALETYRNPAHNELDFGLGIWPVNPYFNSFSIDVGYTHLYGRTWSWEVVRASYMYNVDKGLTSTLADDYNVQPTSIERPNFILSSDIKYVLAYGKFIFFQQYIRYFRSEILGGPSFAITNQRSSIGFNVGWGFEVYVNDLFSWKVQIRDTLVTVGSTTNNLALILGTGYAF